MSTLQTHVTLPDSPASLAPRSLSKPELASKPSPRNDLARLLVGNQLQQGIHVVTKLGIPDLLKDGPRRSEDLALAAGVAAVPLYRLLRALASFDIFNETEPGWFSLSPMASLLRADTPGSMRPFALWSGDVGYRAFGELEYSIRTGQPSFEHIFGSEFFEYLTTHPDVGARFDNLMAWSTAPVAAEMITKYDFAGVKTIYDLGGGRGELLAAILAAHPEMNGILVEQRQNIAPAADDVFKAAGVAHRCRVECHNILENVPTGGDRYILKSLIHGLDDRASTKVLANCRRAMNNSGRLMMVEFVLPPGNDPFPGKLMDLLMLVGCHGRERTREEFEALLSGAGLRLIEIRPIKAGYSVIEAE